MGPCIEGIIRISIQVNFGKYANQPFVMAGEGEGHNFKVSNNVATKDSRSPPIVLYRRQKSQAMKR